MKKLFFVLLLVIGYHGDSKGQPSNPGLEITRRNFQSKQVVPPSPEAAELGKYGNVPVSLFTGTPTVSIPLVELKGNFLSLPVSLSYNHMGLKPEEIAPWTGLGWALNAGGVITRSVMGDPDVDANYYKTPSPLASVPTDEYEKQLYYEQIRLHLTETQPDVYYYNFMGHSGKFVISPGNVIINKEKSYLKIEKDFAGAEADFSITDEQGIKYEFKAQEWTLMTPTDDEVGAPSPIPRNYISSWYLSKMIAPNGLERIEFDYYTPENAQSTLSPSLSPNSITFTKTEYQTYTSTEPETEWWNLPITSTMYTIANPAISISKKYIKKAALIKNDVTIGYIDFESDVNTRQDLGDADFDGERLLKKVKLYNVSNSVSTLVKEFAMTYAYFGSSQAESPGYYRRLMLKTVQEMSINNIVTPDKPPYTFIYYGESAIMPERYPSGLDHWGYYNGQANLYGSTRTLIPTVAVTTLPYVTGPQGLGANREANPDSSILTVMARINYPTGGYTTFEYEGNRGGANDLVGGVRIKEMIDHSFTDKPAIVKRYEYLNEEGNSSAETALYPNYVIPSTWENLDNCVPTLSLSVRVARTWNATISANSTFGLGTIQGSHVGYRRVTEYQTDLATNKSLGKTVYTYDIQGFNEIDNHIGNGELLKQQTFDNGNKLLEELVNTYTYEDFDGEKLISRKLVGLTEQSNATVLYSKTVGSVTTYRYYPPIMCTGVESGFIALYNVPSQVEYWNNEYLPQRKKLTQQTRKVYNSIYNNYLTYTKNFTYANAAHTYPTLIEETDSKTDKVFTSIKYAADYTISCSPSPEAGSAAAAIKDMQDKNMMGIPVETLQYRENSSGGNRRYINGEYIQHKSGLPEKIYYLQASPMPTSITASTASCLAATQSIDANYRLVATLSYDPYMNLREEKKTDDVVTTYFWGYDNRYPVAKVLGKTHTQSLTSGIDQSVLDNPSTETTLRTELDKLRLLKEALVTTQTYRPMVGMISAQDASGKRLVYEYDDLNRLVNIKDGNDIIKNFRYNYGSGTAPTASAQTLFYNAAIQGTYTKAGCSLPQYGEGVVYKIPYGKYAAANQTDADNLAAADLAANGQNYANAVGVCGWKNAVLNQTVYKADCSYVEGPPVGVTYTVPSGKYFSAVSQADADAKAAAEVTALGQAYANLHDVCSCIGEGKKYINGVCENGMKLQAGSYYENGQWVCPYYYVWSDSSVSEYYYIYQSEPCPIDP